VLVPSLRYWRTQRALLQRELAKAAGTHRDTVRRAEDPDNPHAIRLDIVRRLAGALGVDPSDLMAQAPEA
jgi:transcriptional regulator with XRE-family HTH domain